jgi:hypothetical protein
MLFFGGCLLFWGERTRDFAFVSLCYGRSGEEICTGYMPWPPAAEFNMITNNQTNKPHRVIANKSEEWEVERILDSKQRYRKLHYLVQWAGYSHIRTSWEPFENLENAREPIDEFHRDQPNKPPR